MPATDWKRSSTIVKSAWWKVSEADQPASIKKSGPYGAGVLAHSGSTP